MLPHSDACERNKEPILNHLKNYFADIETVLEIGSGTAQHAVYFAENMPHLTWQTADRQNYIEGIQQRLAVEGKENILPPLVLNIANQDWQVSEVDAIFSANTLHIMSEQNVEQFFFGCAQVLKPNKGLLAVYGPFNYAGDFSSDSNRAFDQRLKAQAEHMGVRDFEWINELAKKQGMKLLNDYTMPANNQLLLWQKHSTF